VTEFLVSLNTLFLKKMNRKYRSRNLFASTALAPPSYGLQPTFCGLRAKANLLTWLLKTNEQKI